jgi:hypothetical protein
MRRSSATFFLAVLVCAGFSAIAQAAPFEPPAASKALLQGIDFANAKPIDDDYLAEFRNCDETNFFRGNPMAGWRKCSGDKNNVRTLLKLANGAIYFESKLGLDLDGSWKAWNAKGKADLKATWYQWPRSCNARQRDKKGLCQKEQVDAEHVPFIVIPIAGPPSLGQEFRKKTGIDKGDFGVVIYGDKWVPAFVADGGPYNKLGEASAAVLAALGQDRCRHRNSSGFCDRYREASIPRDVITIVFPHSSLAGMTSDKAMAWMCSNAKDRLGLVGSPLCPSP